MSTGGQDVVQWWGGGVISHSDKGTNATSRDGQRHACTSAWYSASSIGSTCIARSQLQRTYAIFYTYVRVRYWHCPRAFLPMFDGIA